MKMFLGKHQIVQLQHTPNFLNKKFISVIRFDNIPGIERNTTT